MVGFYNDSASKMGKYTMEFLKSLCNKHCYEFA